MSNDGATSSKPGRVRSHEQQASLRLADPCRGQSGRPAGGSLGGRHRNMGKSAPVAGGAVERSSHRVDATRVPLLASIDWRRNRRRAACARSAAAVASRLRDLPGSLSARHGSQRVHRAHEPAARHGAGRRRWRTSRVPLPRRRSAGRVATGCGGNRAVASAP